MTLLYVTGFGIVGVLVRYFGDLWMGRWVSSFPLGTLIINVVGSFLAGLIYALAVHRGIIPQDLRQGILVGFCGGFTTFSAYTLQTVTLMERGSLAVGIAYLLGSSLLGVGAAWLGIFVGLRC